ncbi:Nicotinamide N-methyltransferase [Gracilariopsis chorda]|uniref:Nicotinamide N-methyltransferase n=1 Tax=Gracilariopsis chorda TaxID=448386 RepID=A0A2V3IVG8_9FLOR|nr:Nicotinamide N-methyltransferase [Gracilariopsis chorda]|eukprot:PXF46138.1 Nicotinamide N-methyltransferase [Gracilariopsis chorda]
MSSSAADYVSFDNSSYLNKSYSHPKAQVANFPPAMRAFLMEHIHNFYRQYGKHFAADSTLLEFGGGPVLAYIISAVPFVSSIVFSDYCADGRTAVQQWKERASQAHDWTPFFEYVVRELEGDESGDAATVRARQLREKLSRVIACDALKAEPLGSGYDKAFNVISISFCFESACRSHSQVVTALKGLARLLRPGGLLRINGVFGGTYYKVNGREFFNLTQTKESLRESLAEGGFVCKELELFHLEVALSNADYKGVYHAVAELI